MFSGNLFMGAGFSKGFYPKNALYLNVGGRMGNVLIEGVISVRDLKESYYLEELEESYLRVSSEEERVFLDGGVFYEGDFRLFGLRGRWGRMGIFAGYERAMYGKVEYVAQPGKRIYTFADANVDIIYGSVKVVVDGKALSEGFWVDYDARAVVFDPSYPLAGGSHISILYTYYSQGIRRDFLGFSYGNWHFVQRETRVRYMSDSLRNASSPGYFPTYYRDTSNGEYILRDSIFLYVGRGRGEYVVEFFPMPGGDYEYQAEGDFYLFVGRGRGSYAPFRYMYPPSRQRRLEYRGDSISIAILEENPNYLKFRNGSWDVEGSLKKSIGGFSIHFVRSRTPLSPYSLPPNPINATRGTFLSLSYRGLGIFSMDSIRGFMVRRGWLEGFLYDGGSMFRLFLTREPLNLHAYWNSMDNILEGRLQTGKEIYSIFQIKYGKDTLEYAFGGGISYRQVDGSLLYWPQYDRIAARVNLSLPSLRGRFLYDRFPKIQYIERYVYVGEGLGDYEYDPVAGRYYYRKGGRFNRLLVPVNADSTGNLLEGSLSFEAGPFMGYAFLNRNSYGLNLSADELYLSLNRWGDVLKGEIRYWRGRVGWILNYDVEYGFKSAMLFRVSGVVMGMGSYFSGVPFLMLYSELPISVDVEYRLKEVSPIYGRGLDLSINLSLSRNVGDVSIGVFGGIIYRNGQLFKNLSLGISQQF